MSGHYRFSSETSKVSKTLDVWLTNAYRFGKRLGDAGWRGVAFPVTARQPLPVRSNYPRALVSSFCDKWEKEFVAFDIHRLVRQIVVE